METVARPIDPDHPRGGILAWSFRMLLCVCSGGFVYPNAFIEGMDLTAIQQESMGTRYDKQ
jgi:hypothetical protein